MLFGTPRPRSYADIVSPLKQIESDLSTYIGDKNNEISGLEQEKKQIDKDITAADLEVKKSEHTVVKISELLISDFDVDAAMKTEEDVTPPETTDPDPE